MANMLPQVSLLLPKELRCNNKKYPVSAGGLFLSSNVLKIYWNACKYVLSKQLKLWNVSHILQFLTLIHPRTGVVFRVENV